MEPKKGQMTTSWITPPFEDFLVSSPLKKPRIDERHSPVSPVRNVPEAASKKFDKNSVVSWLEKFKPNKREELVVHTKKIEEVDNWLECVNADNGARMLLLTGPSGCGKTITLQVLCKEKCFQLVEWITPLDIDFERGADCGESLYRSPVAVFDDFLVRAGRYSNVLSSASANRSRKIVLVKDIPNIFYHDQAKFHQVIRKHSQLNRMLVAFVCSDVEITRKLFPDDLKLSANISTINFNPVVQRSLMKALNRVTNFLRKPETDLLTQVKKSEICESCNGDLRSAILRLQIDSVKGSFVNPSVTVKKRHLEVRKSGCKKTTLVCLLDKDEKIDLFHGLGRVLYPKMNPDVADRGISKVSVPESKFLHDPDSIVETFLSQPNFFIDFLHENYLNTFSDINDVSKASLRLAHADVLMSRWWERESVQPFGLILAVRGLMTANHAPVRSWRPMVKPRSYHVNVAKKEVSDLGKNLFIESNATAKDILMDVLPFLKYIPNDYNLSQKHVLADFTL